MRLPRFISHPNGIVLRVLKQKQSMKDKQYALPVTKKSSSGTVALKDLADKPEKKIRLPSFISHPNKLYYGFLNENE